MHRDPKAPTETSRGLVHTELDLASAELAAQTLTPRGEGRWDAGGTEDSREGKMEKPRSDTFSDANAMFVFCEVPKILMTPDEWRYNSKPISHPPT